MEMIFEQLIKRQNEHKALVERELTLFRITELRRETFKKRTQKFIVFCIEETGVFTKGNNHIKKFIRLNLRKCKIGEFDYGDQALEKLNELGYTTFYCNEDGVWTIKRASIEVIDDFDRYNDHGFRSEPIKYSYPEILGEVEKGEEND